MPQEHRLDPVDTGDVIRSLRYRIGYNVHFHTAGNPGRNDLDDTQGLYYPAICRTIVATDYDGYVRQEFSPRDGANWSAALEQAYDVCNV